MEQIARVYSRALFEAAKAKGKLDVIHEQLGAVADALEANSQLALFFFSPYFSSVEKRDGIARVISGAEPELVNFLELLAERHRMPAIFRIRAQFEDLWAQENKLLDVAVTSAVPLDEKILDRISAEVEKQTERKVELTSAVDDAILGGIVLQVGNMVLDASVRNRLEKLRKSVAQAA